MGEISYTGTCIGGPFDGETKTFLMKREGYAQCARIINGVAFGETKMLGWYNFEPNEAKFVWDPA